jgi:hypothetical protein
MAIKFIGSGSVDGIAQYYGTKVDLTGTAIDLATGNYFVKTITADTTFTVSNVSATGTVSRFTLQFTGNLSYAINWGFNVQWSRGVAPTMSGGVINVIEFVTVDGGTTWIGNLVSRPYAPEWIAYSTNEAYYYRVAVDSIGNVYTVGETYVPEYNVLIAKYNASGTLQWQRALGGVNNAFGNGIAVDSSGNVYMSGGGSGDVLIAKYNTSGTLQWQRTLSDAVNDYEHKGIAVDSSGNVYVTGYTSSQGAGGDDIIIAK